MSKMTLKTEGDKHVVVTRRFAASPEAVYRAHTEPLLIQKWLLGPDGWTMPVWINEARPGGKIRYEWTNGKGGGFHLTGEYLELVPFSQIVHVERMHLPDPTPDNHVETRFDAYGTGTLMTMRMTLPDAAARAAMLATGRRRLRAPSENEPGYLRFRIGRKGLGTGEGYRTRETGPASRGEGGAYGVQRSVRRPPIRLGRVQQVDEGERPRASRKPVGGLFGRPSIQP